MISITRKFSFEAAHAISAHQGPCRNLHGHSYTLEVCVTADPLNKLGMVVDFKDLKVIVEKAFVNHMDHALILKRDSAVKFIAAGYDGKLYLMDEEPTAEQLLLLAAKHIEPELPAGVKLIKMTLFETKNSFATWSA